MATRKLIVFVAHADGEGEDRAVIVHHLDLLPLHAGSIEKRIEAFGRVLATAMIVEDDSQKRTILASKAPGEDGLSEKEYREFVASCEDWAKGR